jgi:RNA 2',3'-cyclic 3'-phosphodiesterase
MTSDDGVNTNKRNLRLFVAHPFPKELWKDAETVQAANSGFTKIRWTRLQNLHVTIFFLGEVQDADLDKIKYKIRNEVLSAPSFTLSFEKICSEQRRKSGMIWVKFLKDEKFSALSAALKKSLEEFLLHPSVIHDPVPHVTVARWNGHMEIEKINTAFDSVFQLPEIDYCELWQTVSTPDGVRYKSLERFEMKT